MRQTWTAQDIQRLKNIYSITPDEDLEIYFPSFKLAHIKTKAYRLGLRKEKGRWTEEEDAKLLALWDGQRGLEELARIFQRTTYAVQRRYYKLYNNQVPGHTHPLLS